MSPALYQRFRPALKAFLHRRPRRDLQAELGAAIEERNDWRLRYTQQLEWNVCQQENSAERIRQVEALRAALVRLLWLAVADRGGCSCDDGDPTPTDLCEAWRALGFEGHFDADKAADLLPLVRP